MAFNEKLSDRIREAICDIPGVEEKYMFGGMNTKNSFNYWIKLCLEFNKKAKSSKKKNI